MTQKKEPTVTTIDTLKSMLASETVELPGFNPGETVTFRLRRSNLRALVAAGKVPNPLLAAAQRLYEGTNSSAKANFGEIVRVMDIVVDNALAEPKLAELTAAGIDLTEEQYGAIWKYAQEGAAALEAFRKKSANSPGNKSGKDVEGAPERADGR